MKEDKAKIKLSCHKKDCKEETVIIWDGSFLQKWYCDQHKEKMEDDKHRTNNE